MCGIEFKLFRFNQYEEIRYTLNEESSVGGSVR